MFHNSMADEFVVLHEVFGFSRDQIKTFVLNGINASWQAADSKAAMAQAFRDDPAWR